MTGKLNISSHELRASGGAASVIARDPENPLKKALSDAQDAASAMKHWGIGKRLSGTDTAWSEALGNLMARLTEHADGLRLVANGHDIDEEYVMKKFKGW